MLFTLKRKVNEFPSLLFVEGTKFSSTMGMNPVAFIVHYLCLTIKPSLAEQPPHTIIQKDRRHGLVKADIEAMPLFLHAFN